MTLEAVVVPNKFDDPIRVRYIGVRGREDDRVVTVIEARSPTNKSGSGRSEYLMKRRTLLYEDVNVVELDLLLRGRRIEMAAPIPAGDFYAMISRGDHRPDCEVYAWNPADALPVIPIPLSPPDIDIAIDLQDVFATAFERGPYDQLARYDRPVRLTLSDPVQRRVDDRVRAGNA
jgi:hypothetical protein